MSHRWLVGWCFIVLAVIGPAARGDDIAAAQAEVGQFAQVVATAAEALRLPFDAPTPNVHCDFDPINVRRVSVGIDTHRKSDAQALRVELTRARDDYRAGRPARATLPLAAR